MMKSAAIMASFAGLASAFQVPTQLGQVKSSSSGMTMMAEMSKCMPFMVKPDKLDGSMAGDVGFDPMGISEQLPDLNFVRAAELKHGRVAMLATVGFIVSQVVHLPGEAYSAGNPFEAINKVPAGANLQILLFCGVIELMTLEKTYSAEGKPGDYGFDPLNFSKNKSEAQMADLELKEIKNGRLAMIAIIGLFVQTSLFGPGF